MAKARFEIPQQLPTGVVRPIYAGVGVTDRIVEVVRDAVADVQKRALAVQQDVQRTVTGLDYQPQGLRQQATEALSARVDAFGKDAKSGRRVVEQRLAGLPTEARELPARLQRLVDDRVATAGDTYDGLVKRGETLVGRIRRQPATAAATSSATTTTAKAKTTRTQAAKASEAMKKSTTRAGRKAAKSPARSSAKATATSARKTATNATRAAGEAAKKVGD